MNVGILGTGDVGQALGSAFLALGHEVKLGGRGAPPAKAANWAKEQGVRTEGGPASPGPRASIGTFAEAAAFGELAVIATLGMANEAALRAAGPEKFAGKIVIDATNPLDPSGGMPPKLAIAGNDSGGEQVQRLLPDAHVVKAFNTVGHALMFRPDLPGGPPDMFICGNDEGAKERVAGLVREFGWNAVDCGNITSSRYLEGMCLVWVISAMKTGTWAQAFKLLKK